ncbi:MAG: type I methionyl aminopeptidase [Lachnospiraceae bacterium]|nr:type I methionyl aminopeptidase [Lachnospiraceae bacterium]
MFGKIGRNDPCWCGSGAKYKNCHEAFDEKLKEYKLRGFEVPDHRIIKTQKDIEGMKRSAKINIAVLDYVAANIRAGMTTNEIDRLVYEKTTEMGGTPCQLGYEGFPKSVCTSINNVVCHGIPSDDEILQDGDIINVDCSTLYQGYYSDSSRMFCIGDVDPVWKKLVDDTKASVEEGLKYVKPWHTLGDVGNAVNQFCMARGYSVVREIGGHGIGKEFHEDPWVSFVSKPGEEMLMVPGLCFTIEPMVNLGTADIFQDERDGWTVYTDDDEPSAQWEVQLVVTEDGYDLISW